MNFFRLAHLSDPHLGPLPPVALRHLVSKRLTGWINYQRSRARVHRMDVLDAILTDMESQRPDHVAVTGDMAHIGLMAEFAAARRFLARLGTPLRVSFVPGNHDVYVRGSLQPMLDELGPWIASDRPAPLPFPYLRRIGPLALVGLSSAVPTLPFMASGTLGRRQMEAASVLLKELEDSGVIRVVLIHHPPHRGGARRGRHLTDAPSFEAMLADAGAELVLHGHNHVASLAWRAGRSASVPILGAPSASAAGGTPGHRAGYHLIDIARRGAADRPTLTIRTRRFDATGRIVEDPAITLQPPR